MDVKATMNELWPTSSPPKNQTYDHRIELMVFERFEHKKITRAGRYSKRVVERAKLAGEGVRRVALLA